MLNCNKACVILAFLGFLRFSCPRAMYLPVATSPLLHSGLPVSPLMPIRMKISQKGPGYKNSLPILTYFFKDKNERINNKHETYLIKM